jgi:pimeloyl-ACP methyl ester carboxylesterase
MADEAEDFFWETGDGLRLHARAYPAGGSGVGLPILCLHGLTRNARDFEGVAPWLAARGHPVIAADMRGRGGSAWDPAADYHLPTYAGDVAALLDARGIDRAILLGTSMGGLIAMALAVRAPGRIAGAIVNDVGPVIAEAGLTRIAAYVGKAVAIPDWDAAAAYVHWQNEAAYPAYGTADWAAMARRLLTERDGRIVPDYDPAIAQPRGEMPRSDPWAAWAALATAGPVLLLRGQRSDILEAAVADAMAAGRPGVWRLEVPAVGHAPTLDEPMVRVAIAEWLAGIG